VVHTERKRDAIPATAKDKVDTYGGALVKEGRPKAEYSRVWMGELNSKAIRWIWSEVGPRSGSSGLMKKVEKR